jgi:hypothetical protein
MDHDYLSVFFKDVGFVPAAADLPQVKRHVERLIASRIENHESLFHSVLLTPRDLKDTFYFPEGNIDHQGLRGDRTSPSAGSPTNRWGATTGWAGSRASITVGPAATPADR